MAVQPQTETPSGALPPGTLVPARPDVQLEPGARLESGSHAAHDQALSLRTGEPVRPATAFWAAAFGYATALLSLIAWGFMWRTSITDVFHAARVVQWYRPQMSSWQAVFTPLLLLAISAVVSVPAMVSGHFGWNGYRRARWGATFAALVSPVTWLLTPLAMVAIVPAVATALMLWTPSWRRYALAQSRFRARRGEVEQNPRVERPRYGPAGR